MESPPILKMDLKKLFKPTLNRLLLSLILFSMFVPFINYDNGIRCIAAGCDTINIGSFAIYAIFGFPYIYQINYLILLAGIVVSYLISCITIKNSK